MATTKTYPVPTWVRTIVCLAPFVMAGVFAALYLITGRGYMLLALPLTLCVTVIKHVLNKQ